MITFTGRSFTGKVQTGKGGNYILHSDAITIYEVLMEVMMPSENDTGEENYIPSSDEPGEDVASMYEFLFDQNGEFQFDMCNSLCETYWSIQGEGNLTEKNYQCVQVIESDNENNETPGEYLCCTKTVFSQ